MTTPTPKTRATAATRATAKTRSTIWPLMCVMCELSIYGAIERKRHTINWLIEWYIHIYIRCTYLLYWIGLNHSILSLDYFLLIPIAVCQSISRLNPGLCVHSYSGTCSWFQPHMLLAMQMTNAQECLYVCVCVCCLHSCHSRDVNVRFLPIGYNIELLYFRIKFHCDTTHILNQPQQNGTSSELSWNAGNNLYNRQRMNATKRVCVCVCEQRKSGLPQSF